jgi:hypothetical protein
MNKIEIEKLADALKRADKAALAVANTEDGGTCNFDTPLIKLPRWKTSEIKEVSEKSGIEIGDQLSGWHKGYRFVDTTKHGQANCRTRMAEAAYHSLEADGYDVCMYYQMD